MLEWKFNRPGRWWERIAFYLLLGVVFVFEKIPFGLLLLLSIGAVVQSIARTVRSAGKALRRFARFHLSS
jgi:hypothetical protein